MALVVEDGTCVATANAFVTRAELIAYAADYQPSLTIASDTITDAAILRASAWLSAFPDWDGSLKCGRGLQGLAWPRTGVTDCGGDAVPSDEVPQEVKTSAFLASLAELASPGILAPTVIPGEQRKSVQVDVISVTYMSPSEQGALPGSTNPVTALRPVFVAIEDLLKCMATLPGGPEVPWPWVA